MSANTTIGDLIVPDGKLIQNTFQIALRDGGVVTLDRDGNLTLPEGSTMNEAAQIFFREVARLAHLDAIPAQLRAAGELVRTQDNRITAEPMFCVQQRIRDYGFSVDYTDNHVWIERDEGREADAEQAAILDAGRKVDGVYPEGFVRTGYRDRWEFVTACFTKAGADAYIAANGHNLTEPRIYVESGYRNTEWIAVRAFLKGLKP